MGILISFAALAVAAWFVVSRTVYDILCEGATGPVGRDRRDPEMR